MEYVTEGLKPRAALCFFEQLCAIPHGSGNEKAVSDFVAGFARQKGYETRQDSLHNVYIRVPASEGGENAPAVLLQGHLDMVCEKKAGVRHDFTKEPLSLRVQNGRLSATGTTLGADDGVAGAYMMAILENPDFPHPPLEMLLTSDEETGMTGAFGADGGFFKARRLINLDGGPEGVVLVSCSGGLRTVLTKKGVHIPAIGKILRLHIGGLRGGHSGQEIDRGRGNADKLMGRVLTAMFERRPFNLISIAGGAKENAIPRDCDCVVACPPADAEKIVEAAKREGEDIRAEYAAADPGFTLTLTESDPKGAERMFPLADTESIVRLLYLLPDGVQAKSSEIDNLVVCSSNLGVLTTEAESVIFHCSLRSPSDSMRRDLARQFETIAVLCGADFARESEYPGWPYVKESPLRDVCRETYRGLTGKEMAPVAIHAGVECGILLEKIPGADMVSIGPTMHDYHTPDEWLDLESFRRTYDFLIELLRRLS